MSTLPATTGTDPKVEKPDEDLLGDGSVMKKVIKEGIGWERPKGGAEVRCDAAGC